MQRKYLTTVLTIGLSLVMIWLIAGCAGEEGVEGAPGKPGKALNNQVLRIADSQKTALTLGKYRDEVISKNAKGKQLLIKLQEEYSLPIAVTLYDNPELVDRAAEIAKEHRAGLESVLNGGKMEITPPQLAEVKGFLDDLAKVGDPRTKAYIKSVQETLNEKDLRPFGIKVVRDLPRPRKGRMAARWGNLRSK